MSAGRSVFPKFRLYDSIPFLVLGGSESGARALALLPSSFSRSHLHRCLQVGPVASRRRRIPSVDRSVGRSAFPPSTPACSPSASARTRPRPRPRPRPPPPDFSPSIRPIVPNSFGTELVIYRICVSRCQPASQPLSVWSDSAFKFSTANYSRHRIYLLSDRQTDRQTDRRTRQTERQTTLLCLSNPPSLILNEGERLIRPWPSFPCPRPRPRPVPVPVPVPVPPRLLLSTHLFCSTPTRRNGTEDRRTGCCRSSQASKTATAICHNYQRVSLSQPFIDSLCKQRQPDCLLLVFSTALCSASSPVQSRDSSPVQFMLVIDRSIDRSRPAGATCL